MQSKPIVFILLAASALFAAALVFKNARPQLAPDWRAGRVGVVRDAATGRPIAGAYVVARWLERSTSAFDTTGVIAGRCLDRVVARSDDAGHFSIPARADDALPVGEWAPLRARTYERDLQVYATGYRVLARDAVPGADAALALDLPADDGSASERLARLADAASGFACDTQVAETPVSQAIDADALALACLAAGSNEAAFARLGTALHGKHAVPVAHPCAVQHTVSTVAP